MNIMIHGAVLMKHLRRAFLFLLFSSIIFSIAEAQTTAYTTSGKHKLGYHVYIPTDIHTIGQAPLVIAFSPGGNGKGIISKMEDAAEKMGWILVGCDSLRNRMKDQQLAEEFEDELIDEILQSVVHDKRRIYLAGFSGGAMRAYSITARRKEEYAGVIAYGGWLGGYSYQDEPYREGMSIAIINGIKDKGANNWTEIDAATLKRRNCSVKRFEHGGGHKVAPPETTIEAMKWLNKEWEEKLVGPGNWSISRQEDWLSIRHSVSNIKIENGQAVSSEHKSSFKSIVKQFDTKRSLKSAIFRQTPDWGHWKEIANVGVPEMDDAPVLISPGEGEYYILAKYWPVEYGKKQWNGNGEIANDPREKSLQGYHAWFSSNMIDWKHCGPVSGYRERWVTTAEYMDGKYYIYYDNPNDEDPHLIIDDDLCDGIMGEDYGMVLDDPSHGSDCAVLRDEDGLWHMIYENWDPINAKAHAWDSPLGGHAVSYNGGIAKYRIIDPAVDHRTSPTGEYGEYIHGTTKERYEYEIHEPEQNAYGDWSAIKVGDQYYLFCDFDPVGEKMRIGRFTSSSPWKEFSFVGSVGKGHPDPTIGFAEGQFYLIQQRGENDFISSGPWLDALEVRIGVDIAGNGEIDQWTSWQGIKETYSRKPGFARIINVAPASPDVSSLPEGYGFCFEYRTHQSQEYDLNLSMQSVEFEFK